MSIHAIHFAVVALPRSECLRLRREPTGQITADIFAADESTRPAGIEIDSEQAGPLFCGESAIFIRRPNGGLGICLPVHNADRRQLGSLWLTHFEPAKEQERRVGW